jgi:hypothetical protein
MNYLTKKDNTLLILIFFLSLNNVSSQKSNIWLSYGQSVFMYSPGIEANLFFNKYIGLQLGVNTYFQTYDRKKIVNVSDDYSFNFYNANINICAYILVKSKHKIGVTTGFKTYYGPEYEVLHYYNHGGYNIYFDSSELRPSYGIDLGLFYLFKRASAILKYDTARNKFRIGIGYSFGQLIL